MKTRESQCHLDVIYGCKASPDKPFPAPPLIPEQVEEINMWLEADKYEDKGHNEEGKTWKRNLSDSKDRFLGADFIIFISCLDSYLQYK